jgi:hypothetical protein
MQLFDDFHAAGCAARSVVPPCVVRAPFWPFDQPGRDVICYQKRRCRGLRFRDLCFTVLAVALDHWSPLAMRYSGRGPEMVSAGNARKVRALSQLSPA